MVSVVSFHPSVGTSLKPWERVVRVTAYMYVQGITEVKDGISLNKDQVCHISYIVSCQYTYMYVTSVI